MTTAILVGVYLVLSWLFGGLPGLAVGSGVTIAFFAFGRRTSALWVAAVVFLAAAPFAIMIQGLPGEDVVGPGFGSSHWAAHLLAGAAMALAAFAVLSELTGLARTDPSHRPLVTRGRPPAEKGDRPRPPARSPADEREA